MKRSDSSRMQGVTLIEVMLVIAIATSLTLMVMKQYQMMKRDSDVQQVNYNVDQIMDAAARYYQANCRVQVDATTGQVVGTAGTLDPAHAPPPSNPFIITVAALRAAGYLTAVLPPNPIVNEAGANNGYMVQFNQVTPIPDRTVTTSTGAVVRLGQIIMWRIQVAVEVRDPSMAASYQNSLRADCVSAISGSGVLPCNPAPAAANYLVWERLPSFASPEANSNLWMTNATTKQFNESYRTMPSNVLAGATPYPQQTFLCGN